ncbi:electron transfer flavoprotein subunit beta/FixA family protein [Aeromicrobium sp. CTD01-1L150]|uniref:electron transfer flavoprotein subunit beta/FixA family protein n=1 Tax=Aeromicrobium sp. CTD01-1L150 TaxID=3341830 RepID=UPI0035BF5EFA
MTRVLVAVKRVVDVAGDVVLTDDEQGLDGRYAGHTMSDHDACAIELAIQVAESDGGSVTVVSVGPPEAMDQIRAALALGAHRAVLVETDPLMLGPADVAAELAAVVADAESAGEPYDLVLAGNDAADTGDFQVPIRLAHALVRPIVTGAATLEVHGRTVVATVNGPAGTDTYEVPLPAVASVLEGGTSPRYPTLKGRMAAKKVEVEVREPVSVAPRGSGRVRWQVPAPPPSSTELLGEGPQAAPAVVETLRSLEVLR